MAQNKSHSAQARKPALPNLVPAQFAEMGKKRIDDLAAMQKELLEKLQEANRNWFDRVQLEANLASEFATKMTAARSIPETATAFQQWSSRRIEMAAEEAKHLMADTQKSDGGGSTFDVQRLAAERLGRLKKHNRRMEVNDQRPAAADPELKQSRRVKWICKAR